jgi:hypothetical protein
MREAQSTEGAPGKDGIVTDDRIRRAFLNGARDLCAEKIWSDLKRKRQEWGFSQTQVAQPLGINPGTFSRWEKYFKASFIEFVEVLIVLGIKPDQLDWPSVKERALAGYVAALREIRNGNLTRQDVALLWAFQNHLREWDEAKRENPEQPMRRLAELADQVTNEAQDLLGESLPEITDPVRRFEQLYNEWGASWQRCLRVIPLSRLRV